ncbi:hypothetical protein [Williamsia sterculiae]|uniref:Mce-associated membrane protein n=1 Tax=Williamsia sterculiae TaxID=1344003 RepID=A0A1N7GQ83_9NOCA|nr:hypothetical protein [Williamsia sterculiae]SIS14732.1 Mce-associated membrane protein [Williamsia sterculiae]
MATLRFTRAPADPVPARVVWAVVVLVLAVTVVTAVFVARWVSSSPGYGDDARRQVVRREVGLLVTPDAADPDRSREILAGATGTFRDAFAQSADAYTRFVRQVGTVSRGEVDGMGLESVDGDVTRHLVTAWVATTRAGESAGSVARFRLRVAVEPDGAQLKVSDLQLLS